MRLVEISRFRDLVVVGLRSFETQTESTKIKAAVAAFNSAYSPALPTSMPPGEAEILMVSPGRTPARRSDDIRSVLVWRGSPIRRTVVRTGAPPAAGTIRSSVVRPAADA